MGERPPKRVLRLLFEQGRVTLQAPLVVPAMRSTSPSCSRSRRGIRRARRQAEGFIESKDLASKTGELAVKMGLASLRGSRSRGAGGCPVGAFSSSFRRERGSTRPERGHRSERRGPLAVGATVKGTVAAIERYGIFLEIGSAGSEGGPKRPPRGLIPTSSSACRAAPICTDSCRSAPRSTRRSSPSTSAAASSSRSSHCEPTPSAANTRPSSKKVAGRGRLPPGPRTLWRSPQQEEINPVKNPPDFGGTRGRAQRHTPIGRLDDGSSGRSKDIAPPRPSGPLSISDKRPSRGSASYGLNGILSLWPVLRPSEPFENPTAIWAGV